MSYLWTISWDQMLSSGYSTLNIISLLIIIGAGLSITFGLMGVINLAHGEFMMVGAVLTLTFSSLGLNLALAMILGALCVGVLGLVVERTIIRLLYGRVINTMIATWGLSLILIQLATIFYGDSRRGISPPLGSFRLGDYNFLWYSVFLLGVAAILLITLYLILARSSYGRLARAATDSPMMASAVGVNVRAVNMLTFSLGAFVAGLAGALLAPMVGVVPTMGQAYVANAFLAVIVGGAAPVTGFATAALGLGTVQSLGSEIWSPLIGAAAFNAAAILLVRKLPRGIAGRTGWDV